MDYHIARNGQQLGVFPEAEIPAALASGRFMPDDLCWAEGMADWQPLNSRFTVAAAAPAYLTATGPGTAFNPYAAPMASVAPIMPQLRLASRGARLGAAFLDTIILFIVMLVPMIPGIILASQAEKGGGDSGQQMLLWFGLSFLACVGLLVWNAIWLSRYGQTIAKRMLGIRIVCYPGGEPAGAAKAFWLRAVVNFVIGNVVPLYGIVDACFIFREDKRCLHDLIAETTVVVAEDGK